MLVPTMTPEEIYAEMHKDAAWLQNEISYKIYPQYSKRVKKMLRFPDLKPYTLISKTTHIEYVVIFFSYQHSDWKRPYCVVYTKYAHETGNTLVYLENDRFAIRLYTSHFLQRYRERNAENIAKFEHIANLDFEFFFILRNWDVDEMQFNKSMIEQMPKNPYWKSVKEQMENSRFWQDPDYERYSVACLSGMCLCERHKENKDISIYDTYISFDLLKSSQGLDFMGSYSIVFLNALDRVYPRQKQKIRDEWENMIKSLEKYDYANGISIFIDKMQELSERYPISAIV